MSDLDIALLIGFVVLLIAVMYLAAKIQKLHRQARHLRHIVQKLEGVHGLDEEGEPKLKDIPESEMAHVPEGSEDSLEAEVEEEKESIPHGI